MKPPTAQQRKAWDAIASIGCLVCGAAATIHHVTGSAHHMGRLPKRHDRVVPLCPVHHQIQFGPMESVEALSHRGFWLRYGIDLLKEAESLANEQ